MPKLTLTDMRDAISLYFAKKGQRLTNLQKSPIKKIEEIIIKYNLNMDELMVALNESREGSRIAEIERKAEQDKRDAEYKKLKEEQLQKKIMMWEILSEDNKRKVKEVQYNRYVEETTNENLHSKLTTDKMEEMYKKQGLPSFSLVRESDNVLIVKGVHIHNGFCSTIKSREECEKNVDDDGEYYDFDYWVAVNIYNEPLILELYHAEMLKKGFWLEDGEYYTTIKVKVKKPKPVKKFLIIESDNEEEEEDPHEPCDRCGHPGTAGLINDEFICIECRDAEN
jgi:hypothetical protein